MTFSHLDAGTPDEAWLASPQWPELPLLALDDLRSLVVLSAHPDDETLGAAGLIARARALGARIQVVVASNGANSHPASSTHTAAELSEIRRREVESAVHLIAPDAGIQFLGLPDGQLRTHAAELRDRLLETLGPQDRSDGLLIVAPWGEDGHPDHEAAACAARDVAAQVGARVLEYPIWLWHWGNPDDPTVPWPRMRRLELSEDELAVKARAMAAHRSQIAPLSDAAGDEVMLSAGMRAHFAREVEVFVIPGGADSLPEAFFEQFYAGNPDPWGFETRWYEERKRAVTLACLPRKRFGSALEVGCSTGVLTAALAERCDRLLGVDIAAAPLEVARERLREHPNVSVAQLATPAQWPEGVFDLIVLSEVGYYWGLPDLRTALDKATGSLAPNGVLLACHWRHEVAEYPLGGDEVHGAIAARAELVRNVRHVEEDFLLDVFARPPARSVAAEGGLA